MIELQYDRNDIGKVIPHDHAAQVLYQMIVTGLNLRLYVSTAEYGVLFICFCFDRIPYLNR